MGENILCRLAPWGIPNFGSLVGGKMILPFGAGFLGPATGTRNNFSLGMGQVFPGTFSTT